jgi:hypothetical protein
MCPLATASGLIIVKVLLVAIFVIFIFWAKILFFIRIVAKI